jgi:hypothetical protein
MDSNKKEEAMPLPAGVAVIAWVFGLACAYAGLFAIYLSWG